MPQISITLPTLRPKLAQARVEDFHSTHPNTDYELLIVSPFEMVGPRVVWTNEGQPRGGVAAQRLAFERSTGQYLVWWSDDVTPAPGCLETMRRFVDAHPEPFIGSFPGRNVATGRCDSYACWGKLFAGFGMATRATIERIGGYFDTAYRYQWADPDLALRCWHAGGSVEACAAAEIRVADQEDRHKAISRHWLQPDFDVFFRRWNPVFGDGRTKMEEICRTLEGAQTIFPPPAKRGLLNRVFWFLGR